MITLFICYIYTLFIHILICNVDNILQKYSDGEILMIAYDEKYIFQFMSTSILYYYQYAPVRLCHPKKMYMNMSIF